LMKMTTNNCLLFGEMVVLCRDIIRTEHLILI
jgi:hypothetical protein